MSIRAPEDPDDRKSKMVVHANSDNIEFTACSIAFDQWGCGRRNENTESLVDWDCDKPISCPKCISVIDHYMESFSKVRGKWVCHD